MKPRSPFGFGILFLLVGIAVVVMGMSRKAPDRTTFKTIQGTVSDGKKTSRKDGSQVTYRLTIPLSSDRVQYLDFEPGQVTQEQLENVVGQPVTAEVDGSTCYVLNCQNETIVSYEQTAASIAASGSKITWYGMIGVGLGLAMCLIGHVRGKVAANQKLLLAPAVA